MDDLWNGLELRLRAVANNCQATKKEISFSGKSKHEFGGEGVAIITIRLWRNGSALRGWERPERTPLEPRNLDPSTLPIDSWCNDWPRVVETLKNLSKGDSFRLVVKDGQPVGWLAPVDVP